MVKRWTLRVGITLLYNVNLPGFITGKIWTGSSKYFCVPGLNCYSCPGAWGSCPIGALQAVIGSARYYFSFYVVGSLLLFGALFGRLICAFACPFGLIQDLLYRIKTPKLPRSRLTKKLTYTKYGILLVFVFLWPLLLSMLDGVGVPTFCQYICPAGTLEAGVPLLLLNPILQTAIGWLFSLKMAILIAVVLLSVVLYRPFCRFLCPLGAIYALLNRFSVFGVRPDPTRCTHCGACAAHCRMDVNCVGDSECLRCGSCRSVCPHGAIVSGVRKRHPGGTITTE